MGFKPIAIVRLTLQKVRVAQRSDTNCAGDEDAGNPEKRHLDAQSNPDS